MKKWRQFLENIEESIDSILNNKFTEIPEYQELLRLLQNSNPVPQGPARHSKAVEDNINRRLFIYKNRFITELKQRIAELPENLKLIQIDELASAFMRNLIREIEENIDDDRRTFDDFRLMTGSSNLEDRPAYPEDYYT